MKNNEDLQATEAAEIYVRRLEQKHIFCDIPFRISVFSSGEMQLKETMMLSKKATHRKVQPKNSGP